MFKRLTVSIFCTILSIFVLQSVHAQPSRPRVINQITAQRPGEGKIEIVQDKKTDAFQSKYLETISQKTTITGYTLCIYSGSKQGVAKTKASEIRIKFKTVYPDVDASVKYEQPDWKVYVGNFRNRTDAFRLKQQIQSQFPNYIVERQIDFKKL